ncbi:MAG: chondroitinase-B domain-containing protein [Opitutales bacterium]|nr:chondroitinase-B domain-containing protein [Opitutales bacterium]
MNLDFETDVVGEQPEVAGVDDLRFSPSSNNTTNGAVVIDGNSTPANPLGGKSLYVYDQNGDLTNGDPTHMRFPFNGGTNRTEVRLSFDFQRAYASDALDSDTRVHVALGRVGDSLNNSDFRMFELRIHNNGDLILNSLSGSSTVATYDTENANKIDVLANSHDTNTVAYDLPGLGEGTVAPNTLHLFLDEIKLGEFDFHVTPDPANAPQVKFNEQDDDLGQVAFYQDSKRQGGVVFDNLILAPINQIFGPPISPTNLALVETMPLSVELSWVDASDDEIGFVIERKTGAEGAFETLTSVTSNVTGYVDETVEPEVTYTYRVITDNGFKSDPSNELEVTTLEQIEPLIINSEGDDVTISGNTASFSVQVIGRDPLVYQWYEGVSGETGSPLAGATESSFESDSLTVDVSFWVRISNSEGMADSDTFSVDVRDGIETVVTSKSQIEQALDTALPGDTLVIANGVYNDLVIELEGQGLENAPITIRAETPGQVILTEESRVQIGGEWLVLDGLLFKGAYTGNDDEVIQFRSGGMDAVDCRVTNVSIIDYVPEDGAKTMWVSLRGIRNRVDHCYFSGHNVEGVTLVAWLDGEPDYHRIDHNHFANRIDGGENGWETIRIGTSDTSLSNSRTTVEYNLFSEVDGEIEIISNKSGENIYRYNTFLECRGTLTLRHGHRCVVEGNYFIGNFENESGGVRVIGEDHRVINNYFESTVARDDAAITLYAGVPGAKLNEYDAAHNAVVAFNTFYNNSGPLIDVGSKFGSRDRTILPTGITVADNILHAGTRTVGSFVSGENPEAQTWSGNIIFGRPMGGGLTEGFTTVDPELMLDSETGIQRILAGSPAVGVASDLVDDVLLDIDGQARDEAPDVGADEVSDGVMVANGPLSQTDVGPSYSPGQRPINLSLNVPLGEDGWPTLLSETGAFKDLLTLEPEEGIWPYEPTISFWSDYADKSRWFYIPVGGDIGFSDINNWTFPTGSVWVKHFDIELERGNPDTSIRLETRFLVKTEFSTYGVAYRWNEAGTEATLVGEDGVSFDLTITDNGEQKTQTWSIPSRVDCLTCHTISGGFALSFNTYQLNQTIRVGGEDVNYLEYLSEHQFFEEELEDAQTMPRFAQLDDPNASTDFKARSYLAANCVNCHQPGGTETDPFDLRPKRTLDRTGLIDGISSVPGRSFVTRGDPDNSALLLRMLAEEAPTRMPPLGSSEIDPVGTALIRSWIEGLTSYENYSEWQEAQFGELKDSIGGKDDDPDDDGDTNEVEFINRTDPQSGNDLGRVHVTHSDGVLNMQIQAGPYANYWIETSEDLDVWRPLPGEDGQVRTLPEGKDTLDLSLGVAPGSDKGQFFRVQREER